MATHHHINVKKTLSVSIAAFAAAYVAMRFPVDSGYLAGALIGGIVPALFWLWFWLREDKAHPEPKKIIFEAFIFGMCAVPFAIFFEKQTYTSFAEMTLLVFITWAVIEEVLKYLAAFVAGIRTEYFDEPIDVVMYMISAALGFAAAENALFIFMELRNGTIADGISMMQMRFVGASLLHVASSALIGFGIGFGVAKKTSIRWLYLFTGVIASCALHAAFNYLIMITEGKYLFDIFALLWAVIVLIILLFEKIKLHEYYSPGASTL